MGLSKLKNSKFDVNHLFSHAKTILRSLCNWLLLGLVFKILVLSANRIGRVFCLTDKGKPLMYNRNSKGLKLSPATPNIIFWSILKLCLSLKVS